jgi:flagellar protein FliJ
MDTAFTCAQARALRVDYGGVVMHRFRFKLEAVRRLREQAETSAKEAYARELALGRTREAALLEAETRLAAARDAAAASNAKPSDGADYRARQSFVERRELERAIAALDSDTQAQRIEAGRQLLALAARNLEAVERLKKRQQRAHALASERAENRLLEDIGLAVHLRFRRQNAA